MSSVVTPVSTASRKKLIEVALPLKAINEASAREKSIRHGHPSTLHLWWARRPLAVCRAVLFASLVDDPDSDPAYLRPDGTVDEESAGIKRAELFNLIEELVQWDNSNNSRVINKARAEIARCVASRKIETGELFKDTVVFGEHKGTRHPNGAVSGDGVTALDVQSMFATTEAVNDFLREFAPPVLDPFCGGGSIPVEAQRLGLKSIGSDLNPVPVLITKALIEIPPKYAGKFPVNPEWSQRSREERAASTFRGAQGLAADVRYYGNWMRDEAERRIGHVYPKTMVTQELVQTRPDLADYVGQELMPIAWVWARSVECPNPGCRARTPLAKTFSLSGKKGNEAHAELTVDNAAQRVTFCVHPGPGTHTEGTVIRTGARCVFCNGAIPFDHIRSEGVENRVGQMLIGIVAEGRRKRIYLSPTQEQLDAVSQAESLECWRPDSELPEQALGFRVQRYGMIRYGDLFSHRQLVALTTFSDLLPKVIAQVECASGDREYANAVGTYLAFAVDKSANYWSSLCSWYVKLQKMVSTFGLPTLSMVWDFAEANPFSDSTGNWKSGVDQAAAVLDSMPLTVSPGRVYQLDAAKSLALGDVKGVVATDPPYYDNIGYACLSDFFYVWLRRSLSDAYPDLFSTVLTPKEPELISEPGRFSNDRSKANEHFEGGLKQTFGQICASVDDAVPTSIFYAFKQQESRSEQNGDKRLVSSGWDKMLTALIDSGFAVVGTWPMRTEQTGGLREAKRNALASSILLVCRSRPADASLATRKELMTALRNELPTALRNLQHGNIAPVDMAQAAIGPGMAVFTRYVKVLETDGNTMTVRTALGIINQVLDEVLAEQEGDFDGDTRWALSWFEQFGVNAGPFGVAETLSKAKNTAVNGLVDAGVITARGGEVRLVRRDELSSSWKPSLDNRITVWEVTQHLIRVLETEGETSAAILIGSLGGMAETARDLAYRLYNLCEKKKWADEAMAYNGLVIAWPELTKLALAERTRGKETQTEMF